LRSILPARAAFVGFLMVTPLLALAVAAAAVHVAREAEREQLLRGLVTKSEIASLHAERIFLGARGLLVEIRQAFESGLQQGLPAAESARRAIDSHPRLPDYTRGLLILDAEGALVADESGTPPGLDLSDRQYYRQLRFAPGAPEEVFGDAVIGRLSGRPILPVARRLENPDGSFAGVVATPVDPEAVRGFYRRAVEEQADEVLIVDINGRILFRSREGGLGATDLVSTALLGRMHGSIIEHGAPVPDGQGRLVSARLSPDIAVIAVAVGLEPPPWWTLWRHQLPFLVALLATAGVWGFAGYMARNARHLRRQHEAAEAATRAKSAFLATVSHEVRTPLTAVLGVADLLAASAMPREQRQMVEAQRRTTRALLRILDDILDSEKIEAGSLEVEETDFDLDACLSDVLQLMRAQASEKGIAVELDRDPEMPRWLRGDPARLSQVLFNLLGNAVKFSDRRKVLLSVYLAEPPSPGEGQGEGPGEWVLEVADRGIGMSAEQIARLFRPFGQADSSISRRFGGTGLGLFIVKGLVERMHGRLGVESRPGEGTVVSVHLPLRLGSPGEAAAAEDSFAPLPWSLDVLLADDTAVNRGLVVAGLQRMGQRVVAVENGRKAVEAAAVEDFDLVLLDLQMPVMDGFTALHRIRDLGEGAAGARIVAFTADVTAESRAACLAAGFDAMLAKPLDWSLLRRELWLAARETGTQGEEPPPLIDRTVQEGLRLKIGEAAYGELSEALGQTLRDALAELPAASDQITAEELEPVLHRLRSLGGDLGCTRVAALAQRGAAQMTPERLRELRDSLAQTIEALARDRG